MNAHTDIQGNSTGVYDAIRHEPYTHMHFWSCDVCLMHGGNLMTQNSEVDINKNAKVYYGLGVVMTQVYVSEV
ncbi:unnamed protein product [Cyberlindnera jadinii]|uniref:Uncharacterized protein n=1 Tax=Cyberlindnera jadinii (strain ATCC 18201 / CBS 1600 / BCRC 20928 / JCM 3617 / NBRC 0987 / NRRL Y-1542) TaxID=983966 RepID=A0A0H5C977_CYBJN|nr:unnamed protein product [Cyberlindnera jadinii]